MTDMNRRSFLKWTAGSATAVAIASVPSVPVPAKAVETEKHIEIVKQEPKKPLTDGEILLKIQKEIEELVGFFNGELLGEETRTLLVGSVKHYLKDLQRRHVVMDYTINSEFALAQDSLTVNLIIVLSAIGMYRMSFTTGMHRIPFDMGD